MGVLEAAIATYSIPAIILMGVIGAVSAMLVNRGVAVFHDGLRPVMPEYIEGRLSRKALAATSFALSFGLIIGFGIPFSIGLPIILVHTLLLGTDIIGTACPDSKKGFYASAAVGAIYGIGILLGLESIVSFFNQLPVNFLGNLGKVGSLVVVTFSLFPAVVVAYQYGYKKGFITLFATIIAYVIFQTYGYLSNEGIVRIADVAKELKGGIFKVSGDGMALLMGMGMMFYYAITDKTNKENNTGANAALVGLFSERIQRIKDNRWYLVFSGGLTAVAATVGMHLLAEGPVSIQLMQDGLNATDSDVASAAFQAALLVSLARAISFVPLVGTTAITTGVYSPEGMKFVFVAGIGSSMFLPPVVAEIVAFFLGCIIMYGEIALLERIAHALDKFPAVKACADHIRTAITKMLEISLLAGGIIAGNAIYPGIGAMLIIGLFLLNSTAKKPLVAMAIGPVGVICVGILANILYLFGL
ncbi:YhfT family protein [Vibrio sp. DW001]|uniref:YhfT family protein n=1 Tax=Vibrio sp. DW001 TaxID=2912315 RepID=UPI0023B17F71|nr:YhfT family protein [Vibrio sp. DW001]WED26278.1 YhfT family protein [Vibrio sp. DW001]